MRNAIVLLVACGLTGCAGHRMVDECESLGYRVATERYFRCVDRFRPPGLVPAEPLVRQSAEPVSPPISGRVSPRAK